MPSKGEQHAFWIIVAILVDLMIVAGIIAFAEPIGSNGKVLYEKNVSHATV